MLPVFIGICLLAMACGGSTDQVEAFPTHDEPLATDWGDDHFMGELVVRDGCLRVVGDTDINDPRPPPSFLLVWPAGFSTM